METKTKMNWAYLAGFIESDGAIECFIDRENRQLKYVVKFTSEKNTNTLAEVELFLKTQGFSSGRTDQKAKNRAPSVRIQGNDKVVKFLKKLKQHVVCLENHGDNPKSPLLGVKYRNLCLILAVEELNRELTIQEKIDFKKTFHKENYDQPDITIPQTTIPRMGYEKDFNLDINSSFGAAKQWIAKVDEHYAQHVKHVKEFCGKLNADYLVGLFDGDGGFNISFSPKAKDEIVEIQCEVNLTLPTKDSFIFDVVKTHFEIPRVKIQSQQHSKQMKIRAQIDVKKILFFFDQHPLLGNYKSESLALVKETLNKKKNSFFTKGKVQVTEFKNFVKKVYDHSDLLRKDIQTVFNAIDMFY